MVIFVVGKNKPWKGTYNDDMQSILNTSIELNLHTNYAPN